MLDGPFPDQIDQASGHFTPLLPSTFMSHKRCSVVFLSLGCDVTIVPLIQGTGDAEVFASFSYVSVHLCY